MTLAAKFAECPFFKDFDHKARTITCESPLSGTGEDDTIKLRFSGSTEKAADHFSKYCCDMDRCTICEMYQLIEKKYKK